jgi:hypothetical protein
MIEELHAGLDAAEKGFLISLSRNIPDWSSLEIPHLAELPALRWKVDNIAKLARANPKKLAEQATRLERAFK